MNSNRLSLAKVPASTPIHESASTNVAYWEDRYPMLLATMSGATGKAVTTVANILVSYARTPLTSDGAATQRFMQEHISA